MLKGLNHESLQVQQYRSWSTVKPIGQSRCSMLTSLLSIGTDVCVKVGKQYYMCSKYEG